MSDETGNEKKRPNAKYKLSNEKINPAMEIVYHYNRESRLAKAPQAVRDLYKEQPRRRFAFLQTLISTKPNAILLGTIVIFSILILILSFLYK